MPSIFFIKENTKFESIIQQLKRMGNDKLILIYRNLNLKMYLFNYTYDLKLTTTQLTKSHNRE